MNVKTLVYLVIVLLVINVAAIGTIIYERVSRPEVPFMPIAPRADRNPDGWQPGHRIGLDPEQIERLRASRDSLRQELSPQNDQLDELRGKLFEEISKDDPDREVVDKLVEQMGSVQTEIHKRVVNRLLEDGTVLKPEQRRFLLRMLEERSMQQRGPDPDHWRRMGRRGMPGNRDNMSTSKGE